MSDGHKGRLRRCTEGKVKKEHESEMAIKIYVCITELALDMGKKLVECPALAFLARSSYL